MSPHCSSVPRSAMKWIGEFEIAQGLDELETSASISGGTMPDVEVLDSKVASGLRHT